MSDTARDLPGCGPEDIANAYHLFLGRAPEQVYDSIWPSASKLAEHLIASEEFDLEIAQPILDGRPPSNNRHAGNPSVSMRHWMGRFLTVSARTRRKLAQATEWHDAIRLVFSDRKFRKSVVIVGRHWSISTLAGRLAEQQDSAVKALRGGHSSSWSFHDLASRWFGQKDGASAQILSPAPEVVVEPAHTPRAAMLIDQPTVDDVLARSSEWSIVDANLDRAFYFSQIDDDLIIGDPAAHYLDTGWHVGLDPRSDFSTKQYLSDHPDVAASTTNPFVHYLERGTSEQRRVSASALNLRLSHTGDGRNEWAGYDNVRQRAFANPGMARPELLDFTVALAGSAFADEVLKFRLLRRAECPTISVVMPCWDESLVTAECIASLFLCSDEVPLEIILVDNSSTEEFYKKIDEHPDISVLRMATNVGFGPACNAGAANARGRYLLILNNDTQIAPGALTALVEAIESEPMIAAAGPRMISFDGRLQEAGVIIKADGTGALIGYGQDAEAPRFSYRKKVEHLSAAALLVRRSTFEDLKGFDDAFAPAYCEDADLLLKIRARGEHIVYEPSALVAHHLSKTTAKVSDAAALTGKLELVARNRIKLLDRWSDELTRFDIRTIAFYLPQYHPIPENDLWWGKGFTEWRNLAKATPNYSGHRQPRVPADLGYYDLRLAEIMEQQAALAQRYGISGFCYYYYRFGSKRLLEAPIDRMLATGKPDFPFCICWANENWSRRWDGQDKDILMAQEYGEEDAVGFAEDLARHFRSTNYICIDGKPLVLIYRLQEIPHPKRYLQICRNVWKQLGFADVVVAMVESFEHSAQPVPPDTFGADLTVEFPAHGMMRDAALPVQRTNKNWTGAAHDYRELAGAFIGREEVGFKRLRSVLVGWDTTPRHPKKSMVLEHATPGAFQAWLEWTYQRTREQNYGEERLVFINAWNEWCEGSYLEPDLDFGHAYLNAVKNAQETIAMGARSFVELA